MRVLFIQRQPCIRALKCAAGLRAAVPGLTLGFAAQGKTLTEFYGTGDELFDRWYPMDDPATDLAQAIDAFAPDVIHSHNLPDSLTVLAQQVRDARVPVVHDVHDMQSLRATPYEDGFPDPTDPAEMERRATEDSDALITVSDEVLAQLAARYRLPARTMILPNAPLESDLPAEIPAPERPLAPRPRVVYQGSLSDNGSHYDLREIFATLAGAGVDLDIRPSRPQPVYRALAEEIGATYHDPVPPSELMALLPAYDWGWAGFNATINRAHIDTALPNKAFEYLGCGLPILTLPHAALARFVTTERVGIVLDRPGDAAAAVRAADVVALRRRVADVRHRFTAEHNAQRLTALYGELVTQRTGAPVGA